MFRNQGIHPVTVVFNNTNNCFLQIPSKLATLLSLNEVNESWLVVLSLVLKTDCDISDLLGLKDTFKSLLMSVFTDEHRSRQ